MQNMAHTTTEHTHLFMSCTNDFVVAKAFGKDHGRYIFTVPVGSLLWGVEMHKPIVIALICPLLACKTWQVRDTPLVDEL